VSSPSRRQCSKCKRNRAERFFVSTRGRVCLDCQKATRRKASRKQRVGSYGLAPDEYKALLTYQENVCAICHQPRTYFLNIDHDHRVEKLHGTRASVRGLLCRRCNKLLAVAGDSVSVLRSAYRYLMSPPADEVLGAPTDRKVLQ
jgi:hypothetical protein